MRPKTKREQAREGRRKPGWRAREWSRMLADGLYPTRATLARGEGVSRAAVTQALRRSDGE